MNGSRSATAPVVLGVAFLLTLLLQKSFIVQSDEGYTLNAAWQMWHGLRMYDDFRLFVAPGASAAVYGTWAMFGGPTFLAARVMSLLLSFSSIAAVYLILARRAVRGARLAMAVTAWTVASAQYVLLNHNAFSSYAATWLLFLLLEAQERDSLGRGRVRDHVAVGIAAGVVTLFLQTKGLALLATTAALTLFAGGRRRGPRAALALVGAALAVVAPLFLIWRPSVLLREWFVVPLTGDYLKHTGASRSLTVGCVIVVAAMGALAIRLRDRLLVAVAFTQAALVVAMLHNMESHHVAVNAFPLIVFVSLALERHEAVRRASAAPRPPEKLPATVAMTMIGAMFGLLLATPVGRGQLAQSTLYIDFVRRPSRNIFPQPHVAAARAIYAGPFLPGLYFNLGKENPFFVSETVVCDDDCRRRLIAQIAVIKPEIAFLNYEMIRHLGYDANNPVDAYFRDHYVRCADTSYRGLIVRAIDAAWCP